MPCRLCLPMYKCTRNTSLWLMCVFMGGRLKGRTNEAVFANICEKQNSFFCSLDFSILCSVFIFLYFTILLSVKQCSVVAVEKISCPKSLITLFRLIC